MMANLANGRHARRHRQGRRLLPPAQAGRQLLPGPGHRGHDQGGTTPVVFDWDYLICRARYRRAELEGVRPARTPSWAATTRRPSTRTRRTRPQPGCGRSSSTPDAGPEPLAQGWRPAGRAGGHDHGRHHRRGRGRQAAAGHRDAGVPDAGPGHRRPATYLAANWAKADRLARDVAVAATTEPAPGPHGPGAGCRSPGSAPCRSSPTSRSSCCCRPSIVVVGALHEPGGGSTLANITELRQDYVVAARSSAASSCRVVSAVIGPCSARSWPTRSRSGNPDGGPAPHGHLGRVGRARPVRRRHAGVRVPRHDRPGRASRCS